LSHPSSALAGHLCSALIEEIVNVASDLHLLIGGLFRWAGSMSMQLIRDMRVVRELGACSDGAAQAMGRCG